MTTSLRVQATVTADGKQASVELTSLTAKVADARLAVDAQKEAAKKLSAELKTLNRDTAEGAARANEIRDALRASKIEVIAQGAAASAASRQLTQLSQATGQAAASSGQMRAASANLGQQIGDISQGLALGISPMTIFAQQGGQVAFAMSGMGGAIGRVASFLSGPWGAVITGAAIILGSLASAHDKAADTADKQGSAEDALKKALDELTNISGAANRSTAERIRLGELAAAGALREKDAERAKAQAIVEGARARVSAARADQQAGGAKGSNFGSGFVTDNAERGLSAAEAELNRIEAVIAAGRKEAAATSDFARAKEAAAAATSVATRASQAYAKAEDEVFAALKAGAIGQGGATARLIAAENAKKAALDAVKDASKAARAEQREHNKEVRDAAREAKAYVEQLEKLRASAGAALTAAAAIGAGTKFSGLKEADDQARNSDALSASIKVLDERQAERVGAISAKAFSDAALTQAVAIGQAIGGSAGAAIRTVAGLAQGAANGNYTGVGGGLGGALTLLAGQKGAGGANPFGDGLKAAISEPLAGLKDAFKNVFTSENGQAFAKVAGRAAGGAATGSAVAGIGNAIGLKLDKTGSTVGGAVGSALGPLISTLGPIGAALGPFAGVIGGVLGGLVGGLFGPKGSTTISASAGKISSSGTGNAAVQKATGAIGSTVTDALQSIADQLGGSIGDFSVSIGKKKGQFRIDRSGTGKLNGGTVTGTDSEGEALNLALADALRDGGVKVSSPRVQAALLGYADNVNKAVAEALKVKGLEDLLADRNNPFLATFRTLETQLKQRVDVARQYGFDLVEIEKINGEDRAKALKDTLAAATGSVRNLLTELTIGSGATGSSTQRLAGLTAERDRIAGLARAGDTSQLDAFATITKQIDDLQRETFGSTGGFAAGRADSISLLNELIRQTEDRAKAAADQARGVAATTVDKLTELNASADDQVALLSDNRKILEQIRDGLAAGVPTANFALSRQYARVPE